MSTSEAKVAEKVLPPPIIKIFPDSKSRNRQNQISAPPSKTSSTFPIQPFIHSSSTKSRQPITSNTILDDKFEREKADRLRVQDSWSYLPPSIFNLQLDLNKTEPQLEATPAPYHPSPPSPPVLITTSPNTVPNDDPYKYKLKVPQYTPSLAQVRHELEMWNVEFIHHPFYTFTCRLC